MNSHGGCVAAALALLLAQAGSPPSEARVHFRNVAGTSGVRFVHHYSATPGRYFVESAPGGLAVFDYNGDGRPDIFFTNGAETPSLEKSSDVYANRLYRNDGGRWLFVDGKSPKPETVVNTGPDVGRNEPCHCGSGKKFKKCHGK